MGLSQTGVVTLWTRAPSSILGKTNICWVYPNYAKALDDLFAF